MDIFSKKDKIMNFKEIITWVKENMGNSSLSLGINMMVHLKIINLMDLEL